MGGARGIGDSGPGTGAGRDRGKPGAGTDQHDVLRAWDHVLAHQRQLPGLEGARLVVLVQPAVWVQRGERDLDVGQRLGLLAHALQRALSHVDVPRHGLEEQVDGQGVGLCVLVDQVRKQVGLPGDAAEPLERHQDHVLLCRQLGRRRPLGKLARPRVHQRGSWDLGNGASVGNRGAAADSAFAVARPRARVDSGNKVGGGDGD